MSGKKGANPITGFTDEELQQEIDRRNLIALAPSRSKVTSHGSLTIRGPRGSYSSATFGYSIEGTCEDDPAAKAQKALELDELVTKMCRERLDPALEELKAAIKTAEGKWGE